ncbi:SDR family NAD(P)-dependent oxidoreductase [Parapedomonas caeni]
MTTAFSSIWIVGASTGIGRATALAFARAGVTVFATARGADKLEALAADAPAGRVVVLPCDCSDRAAMLETYRRITGQMGGPPGAALFAAATWAPEDGGQARVDVVGPVFDVNVHGCLNMLEELWPAMLAAGRGRVAIISSVAGFRGLPRALAYGASKAALTHIAEALKFDGDRAGVAVQVIHPGFVKTPLTDKNDFDMPFLMTAEAAADRIVAGMATSAFEITFPRRFTFMLKLARILPYRLYFPFIRRITGM